MRSAVAMSSARWECCRHGISRSSTRHSASDIRSASRSSAGFAAQARAFAKACRIVSATPSRVEGVCVRSP